MTGTQLYDNSSNPIMPITDAKSVSSGVVVTGNTVYDDISALLSRYQTLSAQVSGAATVEASLGVIVEYSTNNFNNPIDAATATYGSVLVFPTASNPYLWQKTVYKWGETVVKTTYTIAATALFPETQIMFAVGKLGDEVGVPASYVDGASDSLNNEIKWYTYPPQDISNTVPCAFIASRSRGANETWDGKQWHSAKYGQYPV
jgi:hypothetical protein